jgi:hypothetical protein
MPLFAFSFRCRYDIAFISRWLFFQDCLLLSLFFAIMMPPPCRFLTLRHAVFQFVLPPRVIIDTIHAYFSRRDIARTRHALRRHAFSADIAFSLRHARYFLRRCRAPLRADASDVSLPLRHFADDGHCRRFFSHYFHFRAPPFDILPIRLARRFHAASAAARRYAAIDIIMPRSLSPLRALRRRRDTLSPPMFRRFLLATPPRQIHGARCAGFGSDAAASRCALRHERRHAMIQRYAAPYAAAAAAAEPYAILQMRVFARRAARCASFDDR